MMEAAGIVQGQVRQAERAEGMTVEHALYAVILLAGIAMRFVALGAAPLMPFEAAQAWPAWLAASAIHVPGAPAPVSALLYGLQSLTFFVTGGSDLLARLWPALLGTATVLLPWFWRSWLGRAPALVLALLFAVDPWLVAFGRAGDSTGVTVFLALLAITALMQRKVAATEGHMLAWERTAAVAAGLLLTGGPQAWSWAPVVLLFALLMGGGVPPRRATYGWFAVALLLGGGGLALRPEAFAALGTSLTAWLDQLALAAGVQYDAAWPALRLAVDQPLLMLFGPLGLLLLWGAGSRTAGGWRLPLVLTGWLVWAILLLALPGRGPFTLPLLGVPLAIAAAAAIGYLLALRLEEVTGLEIVVLLAVVTVLVVSGAIWFAALVENQSFSDQLLITAAILVTLTLGIWVIFGLWAGWQPALKLGGLFAAGVLLLVTVRSSWLLNHVDSLRTPDGFFRMVTLPEVRGLVADVERLSSLREGDPHEAPLQVVMPVAPDPVLGWYLRNMRDLRWTTAPEIPLPDTTMNPELLGEEARPLVVTPPGYAQDPALAGYLGSDYFVTAQWEPSLLPSLPAAPEDGSEGLPAEELARLRAQQSWLQSTRPRLEWLLYRQASVPPVVETVSLWAAR